MKTFNFLLKFMKLSDIILTSLIFHDSEYQGFVIFNHFIVQSITASPSEHFHGTERQSSAFWTFSRSRETELRRLNVFTMQRDRVLPSERGVVQSDSAPPSELLVDRLSEFHLVIGEVNDLSTVTWNVRQEIKPDSILSRDLKTSRGALQGLSKASAFWPYQSCSERPIWASQICAVGCQHLPQTSY